MTVETSCFGNIKKRVWESEAYQSLRNSYLFKASKSLLIVGAVAALVAGVAFLLFMAAPLLYALTFGALFVAKWAVIVGAAALILALLLMGIRMLYSKIAEKISGILNRPQVES